MRVRSRIVGVLSAVLGALVAIIHDFGVDALTPQTYAVGFLVACVVYGFVTNPRSVAELRTLGQTHWIVLGVMAFCLGNMALFFSAVSITGVELSALGRLYVPFCAILGMMFLGDMLRGYRLILSLTIIGVSLAPLASVDLLPATKNGLLLAVIAYFCFAVYYSTLSALFRKQAVIMNSLSAIVTVSVIVAVFGLPPLVPGIAIAALGGLLFSVSHAMVLLGEPARQLHRTEPLSCPKPRRRGPDVLACPVERLQTIRVGLAHCTAGALHPVVPAKSV